MPAIRVDGEGSCTNGHESMHFATSSCSFVHAASIEELRAAIASVTRALGSAREREQVLELVRGRADLRRELQVLESAGAERLQRDRVA